MKLYTTKQCSRVLYRIKVEITLRSREKNLQTLFAFYFTKRLYVNVCLCVGGGKGEGGREEGVCVWEGNLRTRMLRQSLASRSFPRPVPIYLRSRICTPEHRRLDKERRSREEPEVETEMVHQQYSQMAHQQQNQLKISKWTRWFGVDHVDKDNIFVSLEV